MKTTGKYICIALALASVLSSVACTADYLDESDYPMAPGTGDVPVLDFDGQDAVSVSKDGGEYEFSFVANLPWMVESRASWITVTSETRGSGGTGLGLSIVKHGAAFHHAQVELESAPDKGTTVRIIFPKNASF